MNGPVILWILCAGGLALAIAATIRLFRMRGCRQIPGRIVAYTYRRSTDSDGHATSSRFPIYEYEWQGEICRYESHCSGGKGVGTEVTLHIDADGVIYETRSAVMLLVFGLLWVAIALFNLLV